MLWFGLGDTEMSSNKPDQATLFSAPDPQR
jgi:hypothetical protein